MAAVWYKFKGQVLYVSCFLPFILIICTCVMFPDYFICALSSWLISVACWDLVWDFVIGLYMFWLLDWLQARQGWMIVMIAQTSLGRQAMKQWRNWLSVLWPIATCQRLFVSFWMKCHSFDRRDQGRFSAFNRLKGSWTAFLWGAPIQLSYFLWMYEISDSLATIGK